MTKPLMPEVRARFAKRLKNMRAQVGFIRARQLANALGIEENRYTRYERGEVEPSLTLIHAICDALRTSPNELLGFAEKESREVSAIGQHGGREDPRPLAVLPLRPLAWRLAVIAAKARQRRGSAGDGGDPLALHRETAKLFEALERDPFGILAEIAADDALQMLDAQEKAGVAELITLYTDAIERSSLATSDHLTPRAGAKTRVP